MLIFRFYYLRTWKFLECVGSRNSLPWLYYCRDYFYLHFCQSVNLLLYFTYLALRASLLIWHSFYSGMFKIVWYHFILVKISQLSRKFKFIKLFKCWTFTWCFLYHINVSVIPLIFSILRQSFRRIHWHSILNFYTQTSYYCNIFFFHDLYSYISQLNFMNPSPIMSYEMEWM